MAAPPAGPALRQVAGPTSGRTRGRDDLFVAMARRLVYVALVLLPLLHYRAGKALDLSDAISWWLDSSSS